MTRRDRTGELLDDDLDGVAEQADWSRRTRQPAALSTAAPAKGPGPGDPCGDTRCGACRVRAVAMAFNMLTFGSVDYPGQHAAGTRSAAA